MSPEAEIALAALAFTVFCALAGLIWKAAVQNTKVTQQEKTYVAIHKRLDEFGVELGQFKTDLLVALALNGIRMNDPAPSPRSRIPLPPERTP